MAVREDPRLADLPGVGSYRVDPLVRQIDAWRGPAAVLSYELFAVASAEQAARALEDLAAYDVHVVVTARDLGRSVVSAWQERLKFGLTTPLEGWQPKPESAESSEWGWRTLDPSGRRGALGLDAAARPRPRRDRAPARGGPPSCGDASPTPADSTASRSPST